MIRFFLLLMYASLACRPTEFSNSNNDNGDDEPDSNDEYKIELLQLNVKDNTKIAVDIQALKGKEFAANVNVEFQIACRVISDDDEGNDDTGDKKDYGKAVHLGTSTTNSSGVAKRISDKVLKPIASGDPERECKISATTDDGEDHTIGIMTVNAALRLVFALGEELVIATTDKVFDNSECEDTKLLVLQLQTIRGITSVITASEDFVKTPRENVYEKLFVINTVADPQNLTCQVYDNIVSMENSVYEEVKISTAAGFEHKNEKMWLRDGKYWRQAFEVCKEDTSPKTRDGSEIDKDGVDGDVAKAPLTCIAINDELLVYYNEKFKLYKITDD